MSATASPPTTSPEEGPRRSPLAALAATELRLLLREPVLAFWGLGFPLLILIVMGAIPSDRRPSHDYGGASLVAVYVPILVTFVLGMIALNALPPALAGYREQGILRRLQATPIGARRMVLAELGVYLGLALCSALALIVVGRAAFGVGLPARWLLYSGTLVLAAVAMLAIGVLISAVAPSARVANACGALVFFPTMFFAGLWVPREQMGELLRHISDVTPLGAGVGALQEAAAGAAVHPLHLVVLGVYAAGAGTLAVQSFRWE